MSNIKKITLYTAIACGIFSGAQALEVGAGASLGGIDSGASVGVGSGSGGSGGSVDVAASVGSGGGTSGGGSTGGGGADGGNVDGVSYANADGNSADISKDTRFTKTNPNSGNTLIGSTVWSSEKVLIGMIESVKPGPDSRIDATVRLNASIANANKTTVLRFKPTAVSKNEIRINLTMEQFKAMANL